MRRNCLVFSLFTQRIRVAFLLFFCLLACNSPSADPAHPQPGSLSKKPFDPHGRLIFTKHARCRMDCRHITAKEIHEILEEGTINPEKSDPNGHPDPKWAVEGYTEEKQHLRIIVATDEDKLIIITCIELGVEWSCHCN